MMICFRPLLILVTALVTLPAQAHFDEADARSREIRVIEGPDGGTQLLIRHPLTFAYTDELAARRAPGGRIEAPFLIEDILRGQIYYRVDPAAMAADPEGLRALLLRDKAFHTVDADRLMPEVRGVRLVRVGPGVPPPAGLETLQTILEAPQDQAALEGAYVSELTVVMALALPDLPPGAAFRMTISGPDFFMPPEVHFSTLLVDHRGPDLRMSEYGDFWPPEMVLEAHRSVPSGAPFWVVPLVVIAGGLSVLLILWRSRARRDGRAVS
ncbi:MAG: hypothetical protein ACK5IB_05300 [Qingshengfaniella sp.]